MTVGATKPNADTCVRATMSSPIETKERAQGYAETARRRHSVQGARIYSRRIKAGGVSRDFFVVVVHERTGEPHAWVSHGTYTTTNNVADEQGPLVTGVDIFEDERCVVCEATRRRFLRWEPRPC